MGEEKNGAKFSYQLYRFAVYTFRRIRYVASLKLSRSFFFPFFFFVVVLIDR